jgi:clan AA aspartic protease (TIGR02281 family)
MTCGKSILLGSGLDAAAGAYCGSGRTMHLKSGVAALFVVLLSLTTALPAAAQAPDGASAAEYARSAAVLRQRADSGDATAQNSLGMLYHRGLGVARNDAEAARLYYQSAKQGYTAAYANLGVLYLTGGGVARNDTEAVRLFRLGADRGDAQALFLLGHCYAEGQGVPRNDTEAAHYLTQAANRGNTFAQNDLGRMYEDGRGVEHSPSEALRLYRAASEQGNVAARSNLSRLSAATPSASRGPPPPAPPAAPSRTAASVPTSTSGELPSVQQKLTESRSEALDVQLHRMNGMNGLWGVPVVLNDAVHVDFVVDSGASTVSIPEPVAAELMRSGRLSREDFIGQAQYKVADGSSHTAKAFNIRLLMVGDRVLQNVNAIISPPGSPALLGQTFLSRFKSWSIDNQRGVLMLHEI